MSELQELQKENKKFKDILFKGRFESWVFESLFTGGLIEVCTLDGVIIPVEVTHRTKISDIKNTLKKKLGIKDEFRLCFGGSRGSDLLEDNRTLFHYKIPIGAVIHILMETKNPNRKIHSQNIDLEMDQYYIQYYEKKMKVRKEKKSRFEGVVGWTGIPPSTDLKTNKLL